MENIKVSVIMPVYNVEKYLQDTLDSVCHQTLKEIEIICVDDGSTDRSLEILQNAQKKDHRIKILTQQNQFAGVARNNGLKVAKGKYVVFWDSDDLFYKNALKYMYKQCEKDQADLCVCAANRYDSQNNKTIYAGTYLHKKWLPKKIPFSKETNPKYIFNFSTNVPWNKMWRKGFIEENGLQFQLFRQANDTYFSMMSFYLAKRITIVDKPLMAYRINNSASLTGRASSTILCSYEAYKTVYNQLKDKTGFVDDVVWSFRNRLMNGMLYSLKVQTNVDSFHILYSHIKENMFTDFDIPKNLNKKDMYVSRDYEDINCLLRMDAQQYLTWQYFQMNNKNYLKGTSFLYKFYYTLDYSIVGSWLRSLKILNK